MPWNDYPLRSLLIPGDSAPDDPAILIGPDLPPCMQSRYTAAILFRPPGNITAGAPYWFIAQRTNPLPTAKQVVEFGFVRWNGTECGFVVYEQHVCDIDDSFPPDHFATPRVFFGQIFKDGNIEWGAFPPSLLLVNGATLQILNEGFLSVTGEILWDSAFAQEAIDDTGFSNASTTFVTTGGAVLGFAFTLPPSGRAMLQFSGRIVNNGANTTHLCPQIRTGGTVNAGTIVIAAQDSRSLSTLGTSQQHFGSSMLLDANVYGLTPGDVYNVTLLHRVTAGTGSYAYRKISISPEF